MTCHFLLRHVTVLFFKRELISIKQMRLERLKLSSKWSEGFDNNNPILLSLDSCNTIQITLRLWMFKLLCWSINGSSFEVLMPISLNNIRQYAPSSRNKKIVNLIAALNSRNALTMTVSHRNPLQLGWWRQYDWIFMAKIIYWWLATLGPEGFSLKPLLAACGNEF